MTAPAIITERCHYCSRWRSPHEILHLPGRAKMCLRCFEWHCEALKMLSGQPPKGCQECGVSFQALMERAGSGNTPMYLHRKDGVYQVLCRACSDRYERKRLDLYGDTVHGHLKKLKGAK